MTLLSESVTIAIIGSFTTIALQGFSIWRSYLNHRRTKKNIDDNTTISKEAYTEANNFNIRLLKVETDLKDSITVELRRLSIGMNSILKKLELKDGE